MLLQWYAFLGRSTMVFQSTPSLLPRMLMVPASNTRHAAIGQVLKDPTAVTEVFEAHAGLATSGLGKRGAGTVHNAHQHQCSAPRKQWEWHVHRFLRATDSCEQPMFFATQTVGVACPVANLPFFTSHEQASQPAIPWLTRPGPLNKKLYNVQVAQCTSS